MGEKRSLVERIDTFERKQRYNVPCGIRCQGIL